MTIAPERFRIVKDRDRPWLWAYELVGDRCVFDPVGGFKTAKEARKACDRAMKASGKRRQN